MSFSKKRILKLSKGFRGRSNNLIRCARQAVERSLRLGYRDRKQKKRNFRKMWIQQINAGVLQYGKNYSTFIHRLGVSDVALNRKMLAELAQTEPYSFETIVKFAYDDNNLKYKIPKRNIIRVQNIDNYILTNDNSKFKNVRLR
eukprot:TRINITY_DN15163_c0_g1_i1.p1 TRINITY_DN15163_c0_g1~~TRINITY_DN15163_c0_g1_i1.p1  ORF type:complete len:144 (-),score=36.75 TRINITY_DN15163_c0_g1_i1:59-490(-)